MDLGLRSNQWILFVLPRHIRGVWRDMPSKDDAVGAVRNMLTQHWAFYGLQQPCFLFPISIIYSMRTGEIIDELRSEEICDKFVKILKNCMKHGSSNEWIISFNTGRETKRNSDLAEQLINILAILSILQYVPIQKCSEPPSHSCSAHYHTRQGNERWCCWATGHRQLQLPWHVRGNVVTLHNRRSVFFTRYRRCMNRKGERPHRWA